MPDIFYTRKEIKLHTLPDFITHARLFPLCNVDVES